MEKIFYLLLGCAGLVALFFGVKLYLKKKKDAPIIIDATDRIIEEKEDK